MKVNAFDLHAGLLIKKRETADAEQITDSALELMENLNQKAKKISFLGLKLQIEALKDDFDGSKKIWRKQTY